MSNVLQMRNYSRLFTRDDWKSGMQPLKLPTGPMVEGVQAWDFFYPPQLQFRTKSKTGWSEWETVPLVKEGDPSAEPLADNPD